MIVWIYLVAVDLLFVDWLLNVAVIFLLRCDFLLSDLCCVILVWLWVLCVMVVGISWFVFDSLCEVDWFADDYWFGLWFSVLVCYGFADLLRG